MKTDGKTFQRTVGSRRPLKVNVVLKEEVRMNRYTRWLLLSVVLLTSSCATVLPESDAQRQAIVRALESHVLGAHTGALPDIRVARVEGRSSSAVVHYTVSYADLQFQVPCCACKAKLVKQNGSWFVRWTKADVSLLTRIVLPYGK